MRFVYFIHSLASCWNHGNAHFLRGILRELVARGHDVRAYEPMDGWSRLNLLRDHGQGALDRFAVDFPDLAPLVRSTPPPGPLPQGEEEKSPLPLREGVGGGGRLATSPDLDAMLDGADAVIVHEWNDPALVAAIGRKRAGGGRFRLLFHDTHHRAVSDPAAINAFDLSGYDGVLAFGETLARVYRDHGWGAHAFTWHEAADTRLFHPPAIEQPRAGVVWIGNWGDEERSQELRDFLLEPARAVGLPLDIHGVRYPDHARAALAAAGARYRAWLPNAEAPAVFARHLMTVHVPRRFYITHLPGIPTIRVFEALACGIPLISAPWRDSEALFTPGRDFLFAETPARMRAHMRALAADAGLRRALASHGLATIAARHTCAHRVDELLAILARLGATRPMEMA